MMPITHSRHRAEPAAAKVGDAASVEAKPEAAKSAEATPANSVETTSSDNKPAEITSSEAKPFEAASSDVKSANADAAAKDAEKIDAGQALTQAISNAAKTAVSAHESAKIDDKPVEAKIDATPVEAKSVEAKSEDVQTGAVKTETAKVDAPKAVEKAAEKPAEPAKAIAAAPDAKNVKKDTARLPGAEKTAKREPPKRTGLIAVFISRKDLKLCVRQVGSAAVRRPRHDRAERSTVGHPCTTAATDSNDANLLHWSVVSMPVLARNPARDDDEDRPCAAGAAAAPAEVKPARCRNSPAEALDRITAAAGGHDASPKR